MSPTVGMEEIIPAIFAIEERIPEIEILKDSLLSFSNDWIARSMCFSSSYCEPGMELRNVCNLYSKACCSSNSPNVSSGLLRMCFNIMANSKGGYANLDIKADELSWENHVIASGELECDLSLIHISEPTRR